MKITKYLHSCLLIEHDGKTILIDPGNFTYDEKVFPLSSLTNLDAVFITHEHPDHCYTPFLKDLLQKFPNAQIISNSSVVASLQKENLQATESIPSFAHVETVHHEKLWDKNSPLNSVFTLFNFLTHPGDSLHFSKSAPVLALPLQAPWGSVTQAVESALQMKPKTIIPIHDYHWKDSIRKGIYQRLKEFFATQQIDFKPIETGEIIEV